MQLSLSTLTTVDLGVFKMITFKFNFLFLVLLSQYGFCVDPDSFEKFYTDTMVGADKQNKFILDVLWNGALSNNTAHVTTQCVTDILTFRQNVYSYQDWAVKSELFLTYVIF